MVGEAKGPYQAVCVDDPWWCVVGPSTPSASKSWFSESYAKHEAKILNAAHAAGVEEGTDRFRMYLATEACPKCIDKVLKALGDGEGGTVSGP